MSPLRNSSLFTNKAARALMACTNCRVRKVKCERHDENQSCKRCTKLNISCQVKSVRDHELRTPKDSTSFSKRTVSTVTRASSTVSRIKLPQVYPLGQVLCYPAQTYDQQSSGESSPVYSDFSSDIQYMSKGQGEASIYDYQTHEMHKASMRRDTAAAQIFYGVPDTGYPFTQTQQMDPRQYYSSYDLMPLVTPLMNNISDSRYHS
ncbi:hypothetical protein C8J56DRAFT_916822, partial [Mycena floridula]